MCTSGRYLRAAVARCELASAAADAGVDAATAPSTAATAVAAAAAAAIAAAAAAAVPSLVKQTAESVFVVVLCFIRRRAGILFSGSCWRYSCFLLMRVM